MPIMLRRAWFWGLHEEIEKPHLFHFVFLVNHNRIVMWELGAKGYIPKPDAWCEHAFTQVMSPRIRLHLEFTPNDRQPRIRLMKPHGNFPIQYLQHTICRKNAAQQARRNPGDPRSRPWGWSATSFNFGSATYMHKQLQQYFQSTPTCISSNIFSTAQLIMVSTSTAQLLASQDINRLFRLCVHPGPASSHISQPLVASFDKTATAPQTEQQWQSCNLDATFTQKQSHRYHFLYGRPRAGGSERASFTA